MEKLKPINYDDGTCKEYQEEIDHLRAVNKELLEVLKALMRQPLPTIEVDGKVYAANFSNRICEKALKALAKAEMKSGYPADVVTDNFDDLLTEDEG